MQFFTCSFDCSIYLPSVKKYCSFSKINTKGYESIINEKILDKWINIGYFYFDFSVGGLFTREYAGANVPWTMGKVVDLLAHLWIPAIVLGTSGTAAIIRIMRANLLDELSKPYVVTARAKGLHEWKAVMKYPVRVALNPILSLSAYIFPVLISGSIIVSVVLGLPTVGPLLLRALLAEDLFMASSIVLMLGGMTVLGTIVSDILLVIADPRIRMVNQ